jgi:hypothetical protein
MHRRALGFIPQQISEIDRPDYIYFDNNVDEASAIFYPFIGPVGRFVGHFKRPAGLCPKID